MDDTLVKQYQAMIHRVATKYKHAMWNFEQADFEQELWVWLLEFLKVTPDAKMEDLYQNLTSEARRRLRTPHMRIERNYGEHTLQQKAAFAWAEYLLTVDYPERAILTWVKFGMADNEIAERLEICYQEVTQKRKVLVQNFKVFLRRYLDRA